MASNNSLNQFKAAFSGGTRANRFQVFPNFPSAVTLPSSTITKSSFTISSASLPKADVGVIGVPFRGRMAYFAGDRQYSVWPIKIYDDNDNALWKAFQSWKEQLDGHLTHQVANGDFSYTSLQTDFYVQQLKTNGELLREIRLIRCWPSEVGGINFDLGSSEFVTFDVTLTFDNIEITQGI
jgi:hypothetical protein